MTTARRTCLLARVAVAAATLVLLSSCSPEGEPGTDESGPGSAPPAAPQERDSPSAPRPNLLINVLACERLADSLRTTASVRNVGQEDVRYVDVTLTWSDAAGNVVTTDIASVVQGETIMAGDSMVFEVATADPLATECAASVFFFEPIP